MRNKDRFHTLLQKMLITSRKELKQMLEDGLTDEQILKIEEEKTVNYQKYKKETPLSN